MTNQGLTRPWVGVKPLMAREAGFAFVMLQGCDNMNDYVYKKTESNILATAASLGVGVTGAAATQPFDVIATHSQLKDGKTPLKEIVSNIYKTNGFKGFWKGLPQRAVLFTGCATIIPRAEKLISQNI